MTDNGKKGTRSCLHSLFLTQTHRVYPLGQSLVHFLPQKIFAKLIFRDILKPALFMFMFAR